MQPPTPPPPPGAPSPTNPSPESTPAPATTTPHGTLAASPPLPKVPGSTTPTHQSARAPGRSKEARWADSSPSSGGGAAAMSTSPGPRSYRDVVATVYSEVPHPPAAQDLRPPPRIVLQVARAPLI
nr:unnamed protein product [Digitaria exilis]